jgi:hypothetical protein
VSRDFSLGTPALNFANSELRETVVLLQSPWKEEGCLDFFFDLPFKAFISLEKNTNFQKDIKCHSSQKMWPCGAPKMCLFVHQWAHNIPHSIQK